MLDRQAEHGWAKDVARWTAERSALLSDTAARLLATADPQGAVEELCRKVMGFLDCDAFFNYLVDERSGRLRLNACAGVPAETAQAIEWLDKGVAVCGCVAREDRPLNAGCIQGSAAPDTQLVRLLGIEAYCCHPLMAQGRVIGTLSFGARSRQGFTTAEVEVMASVANLVSMAMGRVQSERALRAAESRFRGIYEHALAGIAITGWDGRPLQCNPAFCALTGYTEDELRTMHFSSIVHPANRAHDVEETRRLRAGEVASFEVESRYVKKDGKPVWVRKIVSTLPDENGEPAFVFALAIDIDKRKKAEEALCEGEAKLARDAAALRRLNEASSRLWRACSLQEGLDEMLGAAIELLGADLGNVQLFDPHRKVLKLTAHRGFDRPFLDVFREVYVEMDVSCGRALRAGKRVVIEDVEADEGMAPYRALLARAGCRAVQSTPVVARDGTPLGMLSTYFRNAHRPSDQDLQRLDLYVRQAADFIERCRADERLRESEARYRMLHESLRDAFVQVAMDGRIVECNDLYCEMVGYTADEIRSLTYQELTPGRWHAFEEEIIRSQILPRGYSDLYEKEYRRKDGRIIPVEFRVMLSRDPSGQPSAMWGIVRDISERKKAEAALKESERRFRATFENAAVGVAQATPDGRWLRVNRRFCEILGYTAEELLAMTLQDVTHPADFEADLAQSQRVIAGETDSFVMEKRFARKDGSIVWTRMTSSCVRNTDRSVDYAIGVIEDISEEKSVEEELRQSEERFRGIFEKAGTGIAITGLDGRFQSCNPAYSAMLGYTEEELRALDFWDLIHPEDRDQNMIAVGRLALEEIPSFEMFNRYRGKGGNALWVHKHVSLLRDGAGKPTHIVALVTDMTERKEYENRIGMLLREVNHRAKNMLALVQAIARHTAATSPGDFVERFGERVRALAASQDLLVKHEWKGVDLGALVRLQLAHFKDAMDSRIEVRGPSLLISAPAAQTIGMAVHELATNAGKYGALSASEGRIEVEWRLESARGGEARFSMSWREQGGPPVAAPSHSGFGSTVIGPMAKIGLNAEIELSYAEGGLNWRLVCPAENVLEGPVAGAAEDRPNAGGALGC
jgi:PAS domain S-box-containing protein